MKLTRQAEIAVAILVACARAGNEVVRTTQAAKAAGTTRDHAAQVIGTLVRGGMLATRRGRLGGISLAVPADALALGTVLRHIQPELTAAGRSRRSRHAPALEAIVAAGTASFLALVDRFTIADLAAAPDAAHLACAQCRVPSRPARPPVDNPLFPDGDVFRTWPCTWCAVRPAAATRTAPATAGCTPSDGSIRA
jgi:Rrf2 family protein